MSTIEPPVSRGRAALGSASPSVRRFTPLVLDPQREATAAAMLTAMAPRFVTEEIREAHVQGLMSLTSGFVTRFQYFVPRFPARAFRRLLVSGCSAGTEMLVARQYGFQEIHGTEVDPDYIDICRARMEHLEGFEAVCYDGMNLPYPDGHFSSILSAHIIEHTPSPYDYLREHLRVLEPGGWMFLEFPSRYHHTELHTRLPSFEYLPLPLRAKVLSFFGSSRFSPFGADSRQRFRAVLRTLQPISLWQIRLWLRRAGRTNAEVVHWCKPAPGVIRCLIGT